MTVAAATATTWVHSHCNCGPELPPELTLVAVLVLAIMCAVVIWRRGR